VDIQFGIFLQNVVDFLIIAFCIFMVVKLVNKVTKKDEKKETYIKIGSCYIIMPWIRPRPLRRGHFFGVRKIAAVALVYAGFKGARLDSCFAQGIIIHLFKCFGGYAGHQSAAAFQLSLHSLAGGATAYGGCVHGAEHAQP
ncbi:MAG: MscL family protein, partial [Akkermansia sp.]|nr:MscL family protein [Akkermansia sp.]